MVPTVLVANSTLAMGMPLAMLFLEPQKTMVISSALLNPSRRASQAVLVSASAKSTAHSSSSPNRAWVGIWCHRPSMTAALKAV